MGGAKVELFISDCESDPKKVATEVEKMITLRKPQVMLHVVGSPMTKVALPVCQRHKIAMVGNDYSDELFKLNNPYQFGVMPKVSKMATEMADFFIKTGKGTGHPVKKASVLCQDGSFGEPSLMTLGPAICQQRAWKLSPMRSSQRAKWQIFQIPLQSLRR